MPLLVYIVGFSYKHHCYISALMWWYLWCDAFLRFQDFYFTQWWCYLGFQKPAL